MIEPLRFANGDTRGDPEHTPAPLSSRPPARPGPETCGSLQRQLGEGSLETTSRYLDHLTADDWSKRSGRWARGNPGRPGGPARGHLGRGHAAPRRGAVVIRVPGGWHLPGDLIVASADVADGAPSAIEVLPDMFSEDPY